METKSELRGRRRERLRRMRQERRKDRRVRKRAERKRRNEALLRKYEVRDRVFEGVRTVVMAVAGLAVIAAFYYAVGWVVTALGRLGDMVGAVG